MKKIYSLALTLLASLTFAQTNLVENPGFETGSLSPWQKGWTNSYTDPTVYSSGAHTGTYYAGYVASATTGFYQNVTTVPGETYVLTFWYKVTSGDGTDIRLWSSFSDGAGNFTNYAADAADDVLRNNNGYLEANSTWQQHEVEFTTPAGFPILQLGLRAYNGSTSGFDDFSVVKKGEMGVGEVAASKYNVILNTVTNSSLRIAADTTLEIYNVNGQLVKKANVRKDSNLDVSSLANGVYIVKAEVNGNKVSQKFIKK